MHALYDAFHGRGQNHQQHIMRDPFNILISSAGRRGALARLCRRTLEEMGLEGRVLAADITKASAGYQLCDEGFYAHRFDDPAYIPEMLKVCSEQRVGLLIPTHDRELQLYADAVDQFEAIGTRVVVPSKEVVEIGSDKAATHRWLTENGLPAPAQTTPDQLIANPDAWQMPLLIKPRYGSSSIGVHIVNDLDTVRLLTADQPYLVQTIASGIEYTVDLFVDQSGSCRCAVPRRRLETRGGEVSKGITVRQQTVIDLAKRACATLPGARGVMNIQIFHNDETGETNIIELNPRFGGGYPLTHEAGANYLQWLIMEKQTGHCPAADDGWRDNLMMLRYDDAVFIDQSEV